MNPAAEVLDRPIWNMLAGHHAAIACGTALARQVDPRYGPFAAARDAGPQAQAALAALVQANGELWLVEPAEWPAPANTSVSRTAGLVQMVAQGSAAPDFPAIADIIALGEGDAQEMRALALATEPGPWREWTHRYGQFFGCRIQGTLAAMAGERMQPGGGFAEVSGVCTWPQFRGRGLARQLIARVMQAQIQRGDTPFLFSYASNSEAIALYERLGFCIRRKMVVTILKAE